MTSFTTLISLSLSRLFFPRLISSVSNGSKRLRYPFQLYHCRFREFLLETIPHDRCIIEAGKKKISQDDPKKFETSNVFKRLRFVSSKCEILTRGENNIRRMIRCTIKSILEKERIENFTHSSLHRIDTCSNMIYS